MPTISVKLPDDLAEFVAYAVKSGLFASPEELVLHALRVVRTQTPLPAVVPLTPVGFDSSTFMASLVDRLANK